MAKLIALIMSLLIVVPCYAWELDVSNRGPGCITTQTDSDGNTWMLVERGGAAEVKSAVMWGLIILGVAGWCNRDTYGVVAGTAFFLGAASIRFDTQRGN